MIRTGLCGVVLLGLATSVADAGCQWSPVNFYLAQNQTLSSDLTASPGDTCKHRYNAGGTATYTGLSVVSPPKNGTLTVTGISSADYKPKGPGVDSYTLKLCGKSNAGPGCVTLKFNATIR